MTRRHVTRGRSPSTLMVAAAVLIPLALAGCAGDDASREPVDMIPVLAAAQTSQDEIPSAPDADGLGVQPDTTRLLRESDTETHWVAVGDDGSICLVSWLVDTALYGSSCTPPDVFFDRGTSLQIAADGVYRSTSLLVPSDVDLAPVDVTAPGSAAGSDPATAQLVVMTPDQARTLDDMEVERETGGTFVLRTGS